MTEIEIKALALVEEGSNASYHSLSEVSNNTLRRTLCRAIEQHEAFRREVSDALERYCTPGGVTADNLRKLKSFVIPKPVDPLVEALREAGEQTGGQVSNERLAHDLRAAMKARGYEFTKIGDAV